MDVWAVGIITYNMLTGGKFPFGIEGSDDIEEVKKKIKNNNLEFPGEKISKEARKFIEECLNKNFRQRSASDDIITNRFIEDNAVDLKVADEEVADAIRNFHKYGNGNKFQRSIIQIMLGLLIEKEDVHKMKHIFKQINEENTGSISLNEIKSADEKYDVFNLGA